MAEEGILERENHLHAFVKIARHPVGAAEKHFRLAAIFKIVDAAVFEKAADDTAHADPRADAAETGNQGTLAADDKVDFHASLRGAIEGLNDALINERVH